MSIIRPQSDMNSPPQRLWYLSAAQRTRSEFAHLKQQCPDGVYVSPKPGHPLQWAGLLFIRKGPYAPAVLRFQVIFPADYPRLPPIISFNTDIFHPLVTPLTTYTYTTSSSASDTVSATDEDRLPPGSFSLRHGFPQWFKKAHGSRDSSAISSRKTSGAQAEVTKSAGKPTATDPDDAASSRPISPPAIGGTNVALDNVRSSAPMSSVLAYVKQSFDEYSFLDHVPLEAAGNVGAWKAWRAHRISMGVNISGNLDATGSTDERDEWNWDGVWEQRVRRGIENSTSDSVLYGNSPANDDTIRFVDIDEDLFEDIKARVLG